MNAVIDTNVLVDYLQGIPQARRELTHYQRPAISLITWMEILIGASTDAEERVLRAFLQRFETLAITDAVADCAVQLRRAYRIRLPDAVIWATAEVARMILVTRNTRDFPREHPGIRVPYGI